MKKFKIIFLYFLQKWVEWFEKYILKTDYTTEKSLKKEDYSLIEDALVKFIALAGIIAIIYVLFYPMIATPTIDLQP